MTNAFLAAKNYALVGILTHILFTILAIGFSVEAALCSIAATLE